ncbi:MAG: hypothetical protein ACP5RT_00690 [Candidatus Micrarchaeia archaeon]
MDEITSEFLFEKLQQEKKTGELLSLPVDFYKLAELFEKKSTENNIVESDRYIENFKKLLRQLKERRLQKVLIYLAYNKQLPKPVPKEEEDIYNRIKTIINQDNTNQEPKKIKINEDLPEVIAPSGNKIGPFSKGQVIEMEEYSIIDFILQNKIGEIIS